LFHGKPTKSTFKTGINGMSDKIAPLSFENITDLTIKNLNITNNDSKTAKHAAALYIKNVKYLHIENCTFTSTQLIDSNYAHFYRQIATDSLFWEHFENFSFISNIMLIKCIKTTIDNCVFNFPQIGVFAYGNTSVVIDDYAANAIVTRHGKDPSLYWKNFQPYFIYAARK
jgi:hypothetical protein